MNNKIILGLTGPTGAGKSSLTDVAVNYGFKVIDCDKIARIAVEKNSVGLKALIKAFGEEILNLDGSLNRKELADKAFSSKENTELLNKTLLPFVVKLVYSKLEGVKKAVLDAPTLFESGINEICTKTIAVLADKDIRLSRIIKRDNISKEAALLRINAGKNDEFYKIKSDFIIYNNGESNTYIKEFEQIIRSF